MKIFMSNYIWQCRICSKLPENRVSWGKKSSFKGKNRVLGFWAKSSFPRNAQKKPAWVQFDSSLCRHSRLLGSRVATAKASHGSRWLVGFGSLPLRVSDRSASFFRPNPRRRFRQHLGPAAGVAQSRGRGWTPFWWSCRGHSLLASHWSGRKVGWVRIEEPETVQWHRLGHPSGVWLNPLCPWASGWNRHWLLRDEKQLAAVASLTIQRLKKASTNGSPPMANAIQYFA